MSADVALYEIFFRDATSTGGPLVGVLQIAYKADDESGASEGARLWLNKVSGKSLAPDDVLLVAERRQPLPPLPSSHRRPREVRMF
jgi:hypothetical protein